MKQEYKAICKRCEKETIVMAENPFRASEKLKITGVVFSGGSVFCCWRHKKKWEKNKIKV